MPSAGFLAWFLIIIRACILAPITEEMAGWVRERTNSSFNFVIAHILNSILFLAVAYILINFYKVSPV